MFGRIAYTHKTHQKMADGYVRMYRRLKALEIFLSALASGSLLLAIWGDSRPATIIGAAVSTLLLCVTLFFKEAGLGEQAQKHTETGAKLWLVRESMLSLLVDFRGGLPLAEVQARRDTINETLADIYQHAPRTTSRAYKEAQKALKNSEELFFSNDELDRMLPATLRSDGRKN